LVGPVDIYSLFLRNAMHRRIDRLVDPLPLGAVTVEESALL
jgi:hypothetical protein